MRYRKRKSCESSRIRSDQRNSEGRWMVSKKRIVMLLVIGAVVATMMVLALNTSSIALGYGATGGVSTSTGGATTGAEVGVFGVAGACLIAAGYFLTRKARS